MKYLKRAPFMSVIGKPFQMVDRIEDGKPVSHDADVGAMIKFILDRYQPQQGQVLDMASLRRLNRAIDMLESTPNDGYFVFEDEEWGVVKRVFGWFGPVLLSRNAPVLEDVMNGAVDKKPPKEVAVDGSP